MKGLREDPDIAVWSRITNETKTLEHKLQKRFTCRNQISNNKPASSIPMTSVNLTFPFSFVLNALTFFPHLYLHLSGVSRL